MKKLFALLMIAVLLLGLAACGSNEDSPMPPTDTMHTETTIAEPDTTAEAPEIATSKQPTEPLVLSSNQSTTDATRNPTPEKTHTSVGQVQSTNQGGGTSSPVTYNPIRGDWPEYKSASEVVEKANLVFEGKVIGISFQVLDARTSLPPTSDTEEWNRSLHTVYDVEIISTYKGSAQGRIQVKMDGGIRGVRVDEQLKVLGADASKGIPVVDGMPVLAIGKTYLFAYWKERGDLIPLFVRKIARVARWLEFYLFHASILLLCASFVKL